jgi:hypothetical protein
MVALCSFYPWLLIHGWCLYLLSSNTLHLKAYQRENSYSRVWELDVLGSILQPLFVDPSEPFFSVLRCLTTLAMVVWHEFYIITTSPRSSNQFQCSIMACTSLWSRCLLPQLFSSHVRLHGPCLSEICGHRYLLVSISLAALFGSRDVSGLYF